MSGIQGAINITAQISAAQSMSAEISSIGGLQGTLSIGGGIESYDGFYEATPTTQTQVFNTEGKAMISDFVVNPIPSDYIDTTDATLSDAGNLPLGVTAYSGGIKYTGTAAENDSSDLTISGATVTVPAGFYAANVTGTVQSGSATAAATISSTGALLSAGTNTITLSKTVSNTPQVSEGYISSGTTGNSDVSLTASVDTRGSSDLTASGATVTAPAGYYASSASKTVASGTAGTPTASKGSVSNNSVTVTPSVTNTTGYITGGTLTGTGVSVSASELVSGTYSVTSSGTKDVTNYAYASIPAGTEGTPTATKGNVSNHSISVTPSVTNSAGYITGSTKTGTSVTVSASELDSGTKSITSNGNNQDVVGYASVNVDVPNTYAAGDEGKVVDNGTLVSQTTATYSSNDTYDTTKIKTVTVAVPSGSPNLQAKTNISPSTSSQTIQADTGYDGLSSVQINAMPTQTLPTSASSSGSGTTKATISRSTSDQYINIPTGYNSAAANYKVSAVANGTAGTPTASKGTVSNHSVSVTPSVTNTTGYITGSTKTGTAVTVTASELVSGTYNVASSGTKDVTNYAYASVPAGTEGTPTASKGSVSNHSISVTPSVTNTSGYITGGTTTGTAVTVSASELVSGDKSISSNGNNIDVTGYATVSVSVPQDTFVVTVSWDNNDNMYVPDKTFAQIADAFNAGQEIIMNCNEDPGDVSADCVFNDPDSFSYWVRTYQYESGAGEVIYERSYELDSNELVEIQEHIYYNAADGDSLSYGAAPLVGSAVVGSSALCTEDEE